jgi:hypothetical protein
VLQPTEIYVDDESKLTLHGLVQHYVMLHEEEKNRKLTDLLDALDFNQVRSRPLALGAWVVPILFKHDLPCCAKAFVHAASIRGCNQCCWCGAMPCSHECPVHCLPVKCLSLLQSLAHPRRFPTACADSGANNPLLLLLLRIGACACRW